MTNGTFGQFAGAGGGQDKDGEQPPEAGSEAVGAASASTTPEAAPRGKGGRPNGAASDPLGKALERAQTRLAELDGEEKRLKEQLTELGVKKKAVTTEITRLERDKTLAVFGKLGAGVDLAKALEDKLARDPKAAEEILATLQRLAGK